HQPPLAESVRRTIINVRTQITADAVVCHREHEIVVAIGVQVGNRTRYGAIGCQLDSLVRILQRLRIHEHRRVFELAMRVAEHEVEKAVAVEIELKNPLQHAGPRNIQVLAAVAERTLTKVFEAALTPYTVGRCLSNDHERGGSNGQQP